MIVTKFGGSSLANATQYKKVKKIVTSDPARNVVVVSAPGKDEINEHKITDLLYLCDAHIRHGVPCDDLFKLVTDRYLTIRNDLNISLDLESEFEALKEDMQHGISQDELVSRGEYFSAKLMAAYLGFEFIDSADWIRFSNDGRIDIETTYGALKNIVAGKKVVIPGFYGAMADGRIKIMDRGGSDITGALAAAALDAEVYENWTDVSGILMADPRIVPNAKTISNVTYSELRELSYLGAQVLHEDTIFPVRSKNIILNIRNTNAPENPGTVVLESFPDEDVAHGNIITGIAGKTGYTIFTITKNGMSSKIDSFRKILEIFERYNVMISYAPSGIDCYSIVVENKQLAQAKYAILGDINKEIKPDHIHVSENIAIIAAVGRKMVFRSGSSGKIFQALGEAGINIRMISQGPEELNIIIGIKEKDFKLAISILYKNFTE